jgi:aspartyl protease
MRTHLRLAALLSFIVLGTAGCARFGAAEARTDRDARREPATIAFDSDSGHLVYVQVSVNGGEPEWYVVDTGASTCVIDSARAAALALATSGRTRITGGGAGSVGADSVRAGVRFTLPDGVDASCESLVALDLSGLTEPLGRRIGGILGFDFFRRYVVEIDYERQFLRLHDPAAYRYAGPGERVMLLFRRRAPYAAFRLTVGDAPPAERFLLIDTGSSDAVNDSLLLASPRPKRVVSGGVGIGSRYDVYAGHLDQVELGPFRFRDVPSVAPGKQLVGAALLHRFRLIIDYSRHELILEPTERLADPFPAINPPI